MLPKRFILSNWRTLELDPMPRLWRAPHEIGTEQYVEWQVIQRAQSAKEVGYLVERFRTNEILAVLSESISMASSCKTTMLAG